MAAPDEEVTLAGGTLSGAGTALGTMQAVALRHVMNIAAVTAEEYGGETVKPLLMHEVWIVDAILANVDAAGWDRAILNSSSGVVASPGSKGPGYDLADDGFVLTLTPADSDAPGFTLYQATLRELDRTMLFSGREHLTIECSWLGIRDTSGRLARVE